MLYAALKTLHLLSIILWVGGMIFMLFFLRPVVDRMEAPQKLGLMRDVLRRFFGAVLAAIVTALVSGVGMMVLYAGAAQSPDGARVPMPWTWMLMATLGIVMMAIFGHIRYVLYPRLHRAVQAQAWATGAAALASIRVWVRTNLSLGLLIVLCVVGLS
jgi:uncharacterized membrane protein